MTNLKTDDGVMLQYRVLGEGKLPVVLVHGWMVSGAVYDWLTPALDLRGLKVFIPDQRGAGKSGPAQSFTLERYAKDLAQLVDDAKLDRFVLVGHSMGGQIAQWVAASMPSRVAGLALLNTVPASGIPLPPDAAALFRSSGGDTEKQKMILGLACKQLGDTERDALLADAKKISVECIQGAFDAWTAGGFSERLGRITAPTLVLATDDPFLPAAFLREAVVAPIPRARLVHLSGPGHYPLVERPRETAAILGAFLAGIG